MFLCQREPQSLTFVEQCSYSHVGAVLTTVCSENYYLVVANNLSTSVEVTGKTITCCSNRGQQMVIKQKKERISAVEEELHVFLSLIPATLSALCSTK